MGRGVAHGSWGEGLRAAQGDARRRGEPGAAGAQPSAAPRRPSPRPPAHGLLPDTQNRGTRVQYLGNRRGFDLFPSHSKKNNRWKGHIIMSSYSKHTLPFPSPFYLTIKSSPSICHDRRDQEPGDYPN